MEQRFRQEGHVSKDLYGDEVETDTMESPCLDDYLAHLPQEVLHNILRQLSARPRSKLWQQYVDAWDLASVLHDGGPLAAVARREFRALHSWRKGCGLFADGDALMEVLDCMQDAVHTLGIRAEVFADIRNATSLVNIRSLSLFQMRTDINLDMILLNCNRNLTALCLEGDTLSSANISAIAAYGRGVRELTLEFNSYETLLTAVWMSTGPTLEELCFKAAPVLSLRDWKPCLTADKLLESYFKIPSFCTRLAALELQGSLEWRGLPSEIVQCFGSNLQVLRLMDHGTCFIPKELQLILQSCPNVKVDAYVHNNISSSLLSLGENLRALRIESAACPGIEQAGKACSKIEELDLDVWDEDPRPFLSSFFAVSKPYLRVLHLAILGRVHLRVCMDALAKCVNSIEEFSCMTIKIFDATFRNFAAANKRLRCASVECVETRNIGGEDDCGIRAEYAAVSFVKDFAQCAELQELVLECPRISSRSTLIQEGCYLLRGRGVDVFISGIQYLS